MSIHELKVWPEFFDVLARGEKRFEVRKNDRGFRVGDRLILREWLPTYREFTERQLEAEVTYLIAGPAFGIAPEYVVMSVNVVGADSKLEQLRAFVRAWDAAEAVYELRWREDMKATYEYDAMLAARKAVGDVPD